MKFQRNPLSPATMWKHSKKSAVCNLKQCPHLTTQAPWSRTSSLHNGGNTFLLFVGYPACGIFYGSPNGLRQWLSSDTNTWNRSRHSYALQGAMDIHILEELQQWQQRNCPCVVLLPLNHSAHFPYGAVLSVSCWHWVTSRHEPHRAQRHPWRVCFLFVSIHFLTPRCYLPPRYRRSPRLNNTSQFCFLWHIV